LPPDHLVRVIAWIRSDGRLRTEEDLVLEVLEVLEELGYERRGSRIERAIRVAVARTRSS
jgi:hypothetical protein